LPILTTPSLFMSEDDSGGGEEYDDLGIKIMKTISVINSTISARAAMLMQNSTVLNGVDVAVEQITAADIVFIGSNLTNPSWKVFQHVLEIVPYPPLVVNFSRNIFQSNFPNVRWDDPDETMRHCSLLQVLNNIGYYRHDRTHKFKPSVCTFCEQGIDDGRGISCEERSKCVWRRVYPNNMTETVMNMISDVASGLSKETFTTDESPISLPFARELFGENGLEVIANLEVLSNNNDVGPRILCMTYTLLSRRERIQAIRETWGRRCDGYLAFTEETDISISALGVSPQKMDQWTESSSRMWQKTQLIWSVVASSRLIDEYDFFLLGGDDMFVVVENLRDFLASDYIRRASGPNGSTPVYIGRELKLNSFIRFNSGGAGYVLNRPAVATLHDALVVNSEDSGDVCMPSLYCNQEDVLVASCLSQFGVYPISTTSTYDNREIFHPLPPQDEYDASHEWFRRMTRSMKRGLECCSSRSVSFHYIVSAEMMRTLHKLIYQTEFLSKI